ncbi:hypothetical protein BJY52DRAFT_1417921 [Lactarius psammicola]|nr:hypothetical protein BJY52DRAFT_1417921 [Lactarius psammicola]
MRPVGTDRYRDNDVEAIISYGPQESSRQASYRPRCILRPDPVPRAYIGTMQPSSSSRLSPVHASNSLAAPSPMQATSRHQSRAVNTKKRAEKKYWCFSCGSGFSQSQVLGRHIKDKHETKETCRFCESFTWSRGRPHLYREHLKLRHPQSQVAPPEVRQKGSRYTKEKLKSRVLSARYAKSTNYLPPLTREAPLHNMSYYPCANY